MKRLIYSPKIYAFVRSSNMGGQIYDVSDDIVNGVVSRKINDMSQASLTLRNFNFKYTRIKASGLPLFLPMDLVTIWMQRIAGDPIQQFTGYLDSVPYLNRIPGDCVITASCTLKRLKYSYFDPGLAFFRNWVAELGAGWFFDPASGTASNPLATANSQTTFDTSQKGSLNDGGIGHMLQKFLIDICGWDANQIVIGDIDPDLPHRSADLFTSINTTVEADFQALKAWLGKMMGVNVPSAASQNGLLMDGSLPLKTTAALKAITDNSQPLPDTIATVAAYLLTNGTLDTASSSRDANRIGLYALPHGFKFGGVTYTPKQLSDSKIATQLYTRMLMVQVDRYITGQNAAASVAATAGAATGISGSHGKISLATVKHRLENYDANLMAVLINGASGTKYDAGSEVKSAIQHAQTLRASYQHNAVAALAARPTTVSLRALTWDDSSFTRLLSDSEKKVALQYKSNNSFDALVAVTYFLKKIYGDHIQLVRNSSVLENEVYISVSDKDAQGLNGLAEKQRILGIANLFEGRPEIKSVTAFAPVGDVYGFHTGPIYRLNDGKVGSASDISNSSSSAFAHDSSHPHIRVVVDKNMDIPPTWHVPAGRPVSAPTPGTQSGNSVTSASWSNIAQISANSAFVAQLMFPTNLVESQFLTGDKAFQNDISAMDAIQQICSASMRCFMSLPDGRFCAFYPDYFSAAREPYLAIYDIELEDFRIQLNDHNLVTHMYVTGDTGAVNGQVDWMDRIASRGVASINTTSMVDSFVNDSFMNPHVKVPKKVGVGQGLINATEFLKRYGVRPRSEDNPLIRNAGFEFLLAYQRFMQYWSSQFSSTVPFTFRPEVMAGGVIWFPEMGIQMFVDSVEHTCSYEHGFTTQAVLEAPAIANIKGVREKFSGQYPGMAIAGNVQSVAG